MKVGYLGPKGTFSEEAAYLYFENMDVEYVSFPTILDIFDDMDNDAIDKAVVPIENTIEGPINMTIDSLAEYGDFFVQGELVLPVSQNLLGNSDASIEQIQEVWSISPAIAQCRKFIKNLRANVRLFDSTASAAVAVKESGRKDVGAIASAWAAKQMGLQILADNIQDTEVNHTRFIIVKKGKELNVNSSKTMLLIVPNAEYAGSLVNILHVFASLNINLTWIESRPTKTKLGTYQFYLDAESGVHEDRMAKALAILDILGHQVRILGSL